MGWIIGPATDVVIQRLAQLGDAEVNVLDTWEISDWSAGLDPVGAFALWMSDGRRVVLSPDDRYFVRLIDVGRKMGAAAGVEQRSVISALNLWLFQVTGDVMNRPSMVIHNGSKPLHERELSDYGLRVPASLTSCNRGHLSQFVENRPSIVKTLSGVRARARRVTLEDFTAERHFDGPVHVQQFVSGLDVRAHVICDSVFALRMSGSHTDYRHPDGDENPIRDGVKIEVPSEISRKIIAASRQMKLAIAGWDFKVDSDGVWWCLEANPMPAFAPYDIPLQGEISRRVMAWLKGN